MINPSEEVATLLRMAIEDQGFHTVTASVPDFKRDRPRPDNFMARYDPAVLVWDLATPYQENWVFFQQFLRSESVHGRRFVLTTTNKRALDKLVGPAGALEIIGRPFDLDDAAGAVRRALEAP